MSQSNSVENRKHGIRLVVIGLLCLFTSVLLTLQTIVWLAEGKYIALILLCVIYFLIITFVFLIALAREYMYGNPDEYEIEDDNEDD